MRDIILASASPRRRDLLASLGYDFEVIIHDIDETRLDYLPPRERVLALARAKARSVGGEAAARGALVIAADTLVCDPLPLPDAPGDFVDLSGARTLGKPANKEEARRMLRLLSGREHSVHTGLVILDGASSREEEALSTSLVRFAKLSDGEIEAYLRSGEWEGVAGAYRIQGLAALFINEIRGSWSGIVGLPIRELYVMLSRLSIETPALMPEKFPPLGAR